MRQSYRSRLYELLPARQGIITLEMAAAVGVPAVEVRKLASRGALERRGRGVYRIPFAPVNNLQDAISILDSVAPDAFLVGRSVLSLFDIGLEMPKKYEVFVPRRIRRTLPSTVVITNKDLPNEFELINGVRCEPMFNVLQRRVAYSRVDRVERELEEAHNGFYITDKQFKELHKQFDQVLASRPQNTWIYGN